MINFLLGTTCMGVIIVAFVFCWAAIVIGARYDEHNEREQWKSDESTDISR